MMPDIRYLTGENLLNKQPYEILLVEDDDVDAEAVARALSRRLGKHPITIVKDGYDALTVLRGTKDGDGLHQPYLILLDINMPRMNGLEFLKEVRRDESLRHSIVFILSTSGSVEDRIDAYDLNVAGYVLKSNLGEGLDNLVALLDSYNSAIEFPPDPKL